ncbi:MAG: hypothetical protein KDI83_09385 [Gammaproteobacteria bacterium]|nr:hypothetical protein [Gammaproteobacteria bacterium]
MHEFPIDPDSDLVTRQFALVFTHNRRRSRFPENCVRILESQEQAVAGADPAQGVHPALVYGPSRSSEGLRLYYLVKWLSN